MKNQSLILLACVFGFFSLSNAQIGIVKGAAGKLTNKKEKEVEEFKPGFDLENKAMRLYKAIDPNDYTSMIKESEFVRDSALYYYNEAKTNKKKYSSTDYFIKEVENFQLSFEESFTPKFYKFFDEFETSLKDIGNGKKDYMVYRLILENCKSLLFKKNLYENLKIKVDAREKQYIQKLLENKKIACENAYDKFNKIELTNNPNNPCFQGVESTDKVVVYLTLYSDKVTTITSDCDIYLNGNKITSFGSEKPTKEGDYYLAIPFLASETNFTSKSIQLLETLIKAGLKNGDKIEVRSRYIQNASYTFQLNSKYTDLESYFKAVKSAYLKTIKPFVPTYKNAALEKEVLVAYEKYITTNLQYNFGEAVKIFVSGDNWETKKLYNGNPNYMITNVYFFVKGNDGLAYYIQHGIRKNYDVATKKYGSVFIYDLPEKKEIHPDLLK